jgi:hypothetical protein
MGSAGEREIILKYVFQDGDNLRIALQIGSAFDDIRKKIIGDFLGELEKALRASLDDEWVINNALREDIFGRYKPLGISKKSWGGDYSIKFEAQNYFARRFYMGVSKDNKIPPIDGGKLKKMLDEKYRPGLASDTWEWYVYLEGDFLNWDNEAVLMQMYKKDEAVSYLTQNILKIKDVSSPVIDEWLSARKTSHNNRDV